MDRVIFISGAVYIGGNIVAIGALLFSFFVSPNASAALDEITAPKKHRDLSHVLAMVARSSAVLSLVSGTVWVFTSLADYIGTSVI